MFYRKSQSSPLLLLGNSPKFQLRIRKYLSSSSSGRRLGTLLKLKSATETTKSNTAILQTLPHIKYDCKYFPETKPIRVLCGLKKKMMNCRDFIKNSKTSTLKVATLSLCLSLYIYIVQCVCISVYTSSIFLV